jgi:hypothetical protein
MKERAMHEYDVPHGPRSITPSSATHQRAGRISVIPGRTLSEQVHNALHGNFTEEALSDLAAEVRASNPGLAARFWRLASVRACLQEPDAAEVQQLIDAVRVLGPAPAPAVVPGMPVIPDTGDLSEHLQATFGIAKEVAELKR